jgi:hypothetical protein
VTVRAEFSRPDARRWADGVFEASALDPRPVPGLIGAHFHLSLDGRHMLNLAEWSDEQAHRRQVDESGGPVRTATRLFPGLTRFSFERFELLHHLDGSPRDRSNPAPAASTSSGNKLGTPDTG